MVITAIKQQVKRHDRYSVYVDGAYAFSLSETGLIETRLASGQELTEPELHALKKAAGLDKAYGSALRYVALRPRSAWELYEYLRRKRVDETAIEHIARRLQGVGLLDDVAFARSWLANRRLLKNVSKRRIRMELQQKHVDPGLIDQVLEEDETDERAALKELAVKKQARYPDKQKLMQYLARQGFGYDDIRSVLNNLNGTD